MIFGNSHAVKISVSNPQPAITFVAELPETLLNFLFYCRNIPGCSNKLMVLEASFINRICEACLINFSSSATKAAKNDTRLDSAFSALGKYAVYSLNGKSQITKGKDGTERTIRNCRRRRL